MVEKANFYSYDPSGRFLTSVSIGNVTLEYSYAQNGDLISARDENGIMRNISYDENSWVKRIDTFSSDLELISSAQYNQTWNGRLDVTVSPTNVSLTSVHDTMGNVVSLTNDDGLPQRFTNLPYGWQHLIGDEVVLETRAQGNRLLSIDPDGVEYVFELDDEGNLIVFEDGDGNEYTFSYNENGLQNSSTMPDGSSSAILYDDEGHVSSIINPDNSTVDFTYDDDENLITRRVSGNDTHFEYNADKMLVSAYSDHSRASIEYNEKGFPIEIRYSSGHTLYYGYYESGRRSFIADNNGYNISYIYDSQFRLIEVRKSNDSSLISQFDYSDGVLVRKLLGNGAYSLYTYGKGNTLVQVDNFLPDQTLSSSYHYDYDEKGRVINMTDSLNQSWTYSYDVAGRLIGWVSSSGESVRYTYDNRGNRLKTVRGGSTERYTVNRVNQYMSYNDSERFSYDLNGNLVLKVTPRGSESFGYDAEGKITFTQTSNDRCEYFYDIFGNLELKNCSTGSHRYLVDPFGLFGGDIIAEITEDGTTYFVHSYEAGLLAALNTNGASDLFYEFNMDGSVEKILDMNGRVLNSYKYDAFGKTTYREERIRNLFKYSGQLGVIADEELGEIYMMRSRHYDAQHGRFISLDPIGLNGKSTNLYVYALNTPLVLKDPTGRIVPLIPIAVAIFSSALSTGLHVATTPADQRTPGSIAGAAVGGLIPIPGLSSLAGDIVSHGVDVYNGDKDLRDFDVSQTISNALYDSVWGFLGPGKYLGKFEKYLKNNDVHELLAAYLVKPKDGIVKTLLKKAYDSLYDSLYDTDLGKKLKDKLEELEEELKDAVEEAVDDLVDLYEDLLEWIRSMDPNDMIGPAGYGDAHFIPPDIHLDYTIRFENEPNATAPAQRVFIRTQLDDDLDVRSFRVGTFGFGDFIKNVTTNQAIIQETLDLTSSLGLFVRVRGGLDIIRREATWVIQALDPITGEAPSDPSIGFLPPNNGTTGQGFVTFSIYADEEVSNLAVIDAQASIIFDANEPIETPPIFNTIDRTYPEVNMTINDDLLQAGVLAINFLKMDTGSGVREVDLCQIMPDGNEVIPVVTGSRDDVAILPLSQGTQFTLFTTPVDNVGNRKPLEVSMQDSIEIEFPIVIATCPNNCSGNGNCTIFGDCVCDDGFYGNNCSEVTPPLEPPIFEIPLMVAAQENQPIFVQIAARRPDSDDTVGMEIFIDNLPMGSTFSSGRQQGTRWVFTPQDFGEVELTLPPNTPGRLVLEITAIADGISRHRSLVISLQITATTTNAPTTEERPITTEHTTGASTPGQNTEERQTTTELTTGGTAVSTPGETSVIITKMTPAVTEEITTDKEGSSSESNAIPVYYYIIAVVVVVVLATIICTISLYVAVKRFQGKKKSPKHSATAKLPKSEEKIELATLY